MKSQNKTILEHLKYRGAITQKEAAQLYDIWRLSARIFDLKAQGHNIRKTTVRVGKKIKFARYDMV
jgi:hypothetical protein